MIGEFGIDKTSTIKELINLLKMNKDEDFVIVDSNEIL
tara:strand:- start:831 stop:944 length:114 start_codon:yes stop_codon:yes gene_type:complete